MLAVCHAVGFGVGVGWECWLRWLCCWSWLLAAGCLLLPVSVLLVGVSVIRVAGAGGVGLAVFRPF